MSEQVRRSCSSCQLCCRLLPVRPLGKLAGQRCKHQKFGTGCAVYHTSAMPPECGLWNCRWLVNNDTADLSRPDRAHYVIDIMPDFVTQRHNENGSAKQVQVVQIWCDPKYPLAHRDPALRAYLERRGTEGIAGIVRFNSAEAIVIFPPALSHDGKWHEVTTGVREAAHSPEELFRALSSI